MRQKSLRTYELDILGDCILNSEKKENSKDEKTVF